MKHKMMNLKKGQVVRLPDDADGCTISCSEGMLWLTRENDSEDHILTPGKDLFLSGKGLCVIEAVADCTVCISPAFQAKGRNVPGEVSA
jgi:hypothetical protein